MRTNLGDVRNSNPEAGLEKEARAAALLRQPQTPAPEGPALQQSWAEPPGRPANRRAAPKGRYKDHIRPDRPSPWAQKDNRRHRRAEQRPRRAGQRIDQPPREARGEGPESESERPGPGARKRQRFDSTERTQTSACSSGRTTLPWPGLCHGWAFGASYRTRPQRVLLAGAHSSLAELSACEIAISFCDFSPTISRPAISHFARRGTERW